MELQLTLLAHILAADSEHGVVGEAHSFLQDDYVPSNYTTNHIRSHGRDIYLGMSPIKMFFPMPMY